MAFPCKILFTTIALFSWLPVTYTTETCYAGITIELTALVASNTFLETPGYPSGYPNGFGCGVLIVAENTNGLVKLQVWNSSIESESGTSPCTSDFAEVFDGHDPSFPLLARWCGDSRPAVTTTGRYAFFRFITNGSITDEGIRLEFTSGTLGIIPIEVTTTQAPSIVTTTEASSAGAVAGGVIGGLLGIGLIVGAIILILYCVKKHKGKVSSEKGPKKNPGGGKDDRSASFNEEAKTNRVFSRPVSRREASFRESGRQSSRSTPISFVDSPDTLTPAFSPTPPRTPKGSIRFVESRLRLNSEMGSPATPPPSHREALRTSVITIASIATLKSSKSGQADEMGISRTPIIQENSNE